jgi:hypothetical protein
MTANTELVFNNLAFGRIKGGISSTATTIELYPGDVQCFLPQWDSTKNMYATITDSQNHIEVVKITGISGEKLTAEREQDGTTAIQWYDGAIINQRMNAALLTAIKPQDDAARQIEYNPHGILAADYRGEKVYQTGDEDCEKRWFKNTSGTNWRLIAGTICPDLGEYYDANGYPISPALTPEFTLIDHDDSGYDNMWSVIYEGNYIIALDQGAGLFTYLVDGDGNMTGPVDNFDQEGYSWSRGLYSDGTFVYAGSDEFDSVNHLISFSISEGSITYLNNAEISEDDYPDAITGLNGYIIAACLGSGLRSYSVNGSGELTLVDTVGTVVFDVKTVNNIIVATNATGPGSQGVCTYTINGSGELSLVDSLSSSISSWPILGYAVTDSSTFIFYAGDEGIDIYKMDVSGNLTYVGQDTTIAGVFSPKFIIYDNNKLLYVGGYAEDDCALKIFRISEEGTLTEYTFDDSDIPTTHLWGMVKNADDGIFYVALGNGTDDGGLGTFKWVNYAG